MQIDDIQDRSFIHLMKWEELESKYGCSSQRERLIKNFRGLLEALNRMEVPVRMIFASGSFFHMSATPRDLDLMIIVGSMEGKTRHFTKLSKSFPKMDVAYISDDLAPAIKQLEIINWCLLHTNDRYNASARNKVFAIAKPKRVLNQSKTI